MSSHRSGGFTTVRRRRRRRRRRPPTTNPSRSAGFRYTFHDYEDEGDPVLGDHNRASRAHDIEAGEDITSEPLRHESVQETEALKVFEGRVEGPSAKDLTKITSAVHRDAESRREDDLHRLPTGIPSTGLDHRDRPTHHQRLHTSGGYDDRDGTGVEQSGDLERPNPFLGRYLGSLARFGDTILRGIATDATTFGFHILILCVGVGALWTIILSIPEVREIITDRRISDSFDTLKYIVAIITTSAVLLAAKKIVEPVRMYGRLNRSIQEFSLIVGAIIKSTDFRIREDRAYFDSVKQRLGHFYHERQARRRQDETSSTPHNHRREYSHGRASRRRRAYEKAEDSLEESLRVRSVLERMKSRMKTLLYLLNLYSYRLFSGNDSASEIHNYLNVQERLQLIRQSGSDRHNADGIVTWCVSQLRELVYSMAGESVADDVVLHALSDELTNITAIVQKIWLGKHIREPNLFNGIYTTVLVVYLLIVVPISIYSDADVLAVFIIPIVLFLYVSPPVYSWWIGTAFDKYPRWTGAKMLEWRSDNYRIIRRTLAPSGDYQEYYHHGVHNRHLKLAESTPPPPPPSMLLSDSRSSSASTSSSSSSAPPATDGGDDDDDDPSAAIDESIMAAAIDAIIDNPSATHD